MEINHRPLINWIYITEFFVEMKCTTLGVIFLPFIINILHYRAYYLVTLVQSYRIFCKFWFPNIFGKPPQYCLNSYNLLLTPCKSCRLLNRFDINRKSQKASYKPEKATFIASISYNRFPFSLTMGMILLEAVLQA